MLIAAAPSLMGQTASTGALTGTVTDPSGAAIANVTVTAVSVGSGSSRTATTGGDGSYSIGLLPLGLFNIKFEATGFNSMEVPNVEIKVTETTTLNRQMQVGTQSQQVVVEGEAVEAVQTANATLGDVIGGASATSLPLTTRNYTNLLGLSSGASASVFNASSLGKGSTDISVNGATIAQNTLQMDGVPIMTSSATGNLTENGNNPGMGYVSPDAMEEFKIQTSLFDAGYGRGPGANVNLVTKSGTNQFHGSAFEFFRNTALNANDFFRSENVAPLPNGRPVLNQNQFGGVIGGPVKKDKLFFFASYQGTRQINGAAAQGFSTPFLFPFTPPGGDAARANTATYSAYLCSEFAPGGVDGGKSQPGGQSVGAGVQLCGGSPAGAPNISSVALAILQAKNPDGTYLIPGAPGAVTSNGNTSVGVKTTFSSPAHFTENQVLGNMDYNINDKNTLAVRYFWTTDPTTIPFGCGSGGAVGVCYPDTGLASTLGNIYGVMKVTTILSNNLVNEARVAVQRSTIIGTVTSPFTASQFGMQPLQNSVPYLPLVQVLNQFAVGEASNYPVSKFVTNWEAGDQISWTHDKQTIRFGGEVERDRYDWHLVGGTATGQVNFNTIQDFLLGLPGCSAAQITAGCSSAAPAPGTNGTPGSNIANTGTLAAILPPGGLVHGYRTPYGNVFVQDDFKVNQRLTVNIGLRWEYISVAYDSGGFESNIWTSLINNVPIPTSPTLAGWVVPSNWNASANATPPVGGLFQNTVTKTFRMGSTPLDTFAPRLGFAYAPLANNRLVIRGGAGYFYDKTGNANYNSGYEQNEPYSLNAFGSGTGNYYSTFSNPFFQAGTTPTLAWTPRCVYLGVGTNNCPSVNGVQLTNTNLSLASTQQNYGTPVTYQWNLNVQYEFIHGWTFELGYVGSRALRQPGVLTSQQINEAQLVGPNATAPLLTSIAGASQITTTTTANAALRVPYLGFAPNGMLLTSDEAAFKYNSVQATVRKQFTRGFQMEGAYTYARAFTTDPGFGDPNIQTYVPNPQYHPQRLAVSYLWNLPLGHHQGLLDKLTSGWTWSGVTVVQDGTPLTAVDNRGGAIFGLSGASNSFSTAEFCPNTNASMAASPGTTKQRLGAWFNTSTFNTSTNPCPIPNYQGTNGTGWGNSPSGVILGPGQFNWDMSLTKTTVVGGIREGATLTFRTEFFNTFNHAQFSNPTSATGTVLGEVPVTGGTAEGPITSTSVNPRLIQFALRYAF